MNNTCPTCGINDVTNDDTAKILETISWDETPPSSARSVKSNNDSDKVSDHDKQSKIPIRRNIGDKKNPFSPRDGEIRIRSGSSSSKSSPRTTAYSEKPSPGRTPLQDKKPSPRSHIPYKNNATNESPFLSRRKPQFPANGDRELIEEAPLSDNPDTWNLESVPDNTNHNGRTGEDSSLTPKLQKQKSQMRKFETEEEPITAFHISPVEESAESSLDSFFKKLEQIPPSVCDVCNQTRQVDIESSTELCKCVIDAKARLLETLLTDSDDDDVYTEQETSHFGSLNNRGKRPLFDSQVFPF